MITRTYTPTPAKIVRDWHLIDAKSQVLGRLSSRVAHLLMGKHKTDFARHIDMGDNVVVINAAEVTVTSNKATQKIYTRHSGYPGGLKQIRFDKLQAQSPEKIVEKAVFGMLPGNKLRDKMLKHLHVYSGSEHPYGQHFK